MRDDASWLCAQVPVHFHFSPTQKEYTYSTLTTESRFGGFPDEGSGVKTRPCLPGNRERGQRRIEHSSAYSPNGSRSLPTGGTLFRSYRGAHGNGLRAFEANAWGKGTSTLWVAMLIRQAPSMNQEPPSIYSGECQYVDDLYTCPYISLPQGTGVMSAHGVILKGDARVLALRMHLNRSVTCFPCEREPVEMQ